MKNALTPFIIMSAISCILACAGDFIVTSILGALYPGYSFIHQSESYLGIFNSPVAIYMNIWGVVFCLLLIIFALGLKKTIFSTGKWQTLVVWSIILYGVGEGAGSGLFPYDHVNNVLTFSGELHSVFGALGGLGITVVPLFCSKIFNKAAFPVLNMYCLLVFFSGFVLVVVFLLSRDGIVPYKGLWQRAFILDYHLFLSVLALVMVKMASATERNVPSK